MQHVKTLSALMLASALGITLTAAGQAPSSATDSLQQQANAIVAGGAVGALAEVSTPDGRHSVSAGTAEEGTGAPVPKDGEFRIGSATKTFVATVILQLVDEGRLSLDDTVAHWLPGVVAGNGNDGGEITVRELLNHTSGIYDYTQDLAEMTNAAAFQQDRFRTYSPEQLVAMAMRHAPMAAPGTAFAYSDTDYVLAGMIVQRVTGRSWADEVNARIIAPLGLDHTVAPGTFPFIIGPHAEGYMSFGTGKLLDVTAFNPSAADASGSIISTADDLTRFYTALVGGRLLSPAQLAQMETTVPASALGPGVRYGLGLGWVPLSCGGGYYGHPGGIFGYNTWGGVTADARRAVVVSDTGDGGDASQQAVIGLVDRQLCG
ncbi:beta-lactamase family protein [Catenulispora sp. NL8]|uniref:Beta-lactamase family protein n=1 Tax=Catenulispora pinistramenti TaxID=2705254 RepID=A0ABS5L0U7_9ACTN|nr:serine hydrolase domain-containing protein [Catenulispora pinistramenti]MBS2551926.1 beta-lactamase family protein [Catenulispora pinistramenti]